MFSPPNNDQRAFWGEQALERVMALTNTDEEDALGDTLSYLMHHADRNGISFLDALNQGAIHFQAEKEIEEAEENGDENVDPAATAENPHHYVKRDGLVPKEPQSDLVLVLLSALKDIREGAAVSGRWLDANGDECDESADGAEWTEYTAEENEAWLLTCVQIADKAIAQAEGRANV